MISLLFVFVACQGSKEKTKNTVFELPWYSSESQKYEIQKIELKTLTNPKDLKGNAAEVYLEPKYKSGKGFEEKKIDLRFVEKGNLLIPANTASLQLATVYAHLEKLSDLDRKLGVYEVLPRPRKIGVNVKIVLREGEKSEKNNAYYTAKTDTLIIVPYDREELPITLNAGVIAHEHFHGLFEKLVRDSGNEKQVLAAKEEQVSTSDYNEVILRAWDEGLADFWAWVYTGDDLFMSHSLPEHADVRRLDVKATPLPKKEDIIKLLREHDSESEQIAISYKLGTLYARYFRGLARELSSKSDEKNSHQVRESVAKDVVAALKKLKTRMSALSSNAKLDPELLIIALDEESGDLVALNCKSTQELLSVSNYKAKACQ